MKEGYAYLIGFIAARTLIYSLVAAGYAMWLRWFDAPGWAIVLGIMLAIAHLNIVLRINSFQTRMEQLLAGGEPEV